MRLEPGRVIGDNGISCRVRLVEAIFGELRHQVEELFGERRVVALLLGALGNRAAMLRHLVGILLAHGAAQQVGATERITADDLRDLHHLLLIHDDAVGRRQAGGQIGVEVVDLLLALFAQDKIVDHARAERAGAVQCEDGDDVFETVGRQLLEQLLHALRFDLENCRGVGVLENLECLRVIKGQCFQVRACTRKLFDVIDGKLDDGQVAQTQKVELDQSDFLDIVLVKLRDYRAAAIGRIQRAEIGELARRDEYPAGVHADVPRQVFETRSEIEKIAHFFAIFDLGLELRFGRDCLGQRQGFVLLHRNQLRQLIAKVVRQIEHASDIANYRFRRHGAEGSDLRHCRHAVFFANVFDDAPAFVLAEVDIEVGHGDPFRIQEALKQKCVTQRVEIGNAQCVGDQRAGSRTSSGSDRYVVVFCPVDEIRDDQEVARITHLNDRVRLDLEPRIVGRALFRPFIGIGVELPQTMFKPRRRLLT